MNDDTSEPFDWNTLDSEKTPWLHGVIWFEAFDFFETEEIKINFQEYYDMVGMVEDQIFYLQIGLD